MSNIKNSCALDPLEKNQRERFYQDVKKVLDVFYPDLSDASKLHMLSMVRHDLLKKVGRR